MEQQINSDNSLNSAMLASRNFENILHMIKTSNLNYFLQLSPFAAQISLKKSLIRDKTGVPFAQPVVTTLDSTSDVTDLQNKNRALERKLAFLQNDYEATIDDRDCLAKKCDELEKEKSTLEKKINELSTSMNKKNKEVGKLKKKSKKARRENCGETPVIPKSEQISSEIASSSIKPFSLDSNYNVKVSNLFNPLSNSEESLSLSTAKLISSPSSRHKPLCAPTVTASSASSPPRTPSRTPKSPTLPSFRDKAPCTPAVTAPSAALSPRTPSGTPPQLKSSNPVMVFEGQPVSTEFALKKIKEAFEEINDRFKT